MAAHRERIEYRLLDKVRQIQADLETQLSEIPDSSKDEAFEQYFIKIESSEQFIFPDFGSDMTWLNTSRSLSYVNDLKHHVVVLDFFTYCCINCMHILPHLRKLEEKISTKEGLIVIGVHSAKFDNEKIVDNVRNAVLRYNIDHPVVNDVAAFLWKLFSINCWPTLVILGPVGQPLFYLVGESSISLLEPFCRAALRFYKSRNAIRFDTVLPLAPLKASLQKVYLLYPGKVACNSTGILAISDSGHNRILTVKQSGLLQDIIGGKAQGYKDGKFSEALFNSPQGLAWRNTNMLYVADTENHVIRLVDFVSRTVSTILGTGVQGNDTSGGKFGLEQEISSPWDLCFSHSSPESSPADILYIAMAGTHQIWAYGINDCQLPSKVRLKPDCSVVFAGSGREENRNNVYPLKSCFAQPSGITLRPHHSLYVADSESSSIRSISLVNGAVKNVIGGDIDPMNLFCFGDMDGIGFQARLQHPLGVAWCNINEVLYVADSYNHKIRGVNVTTRVSKTLAGSAAAGDYSACAMDEARFNEPSGLCVSPDGSTIFVADTNNNTIKVLHLKANRVEALNVVLTLEEGSGAGNTASFPPLSRVSSGRTSVSNISQETHEPVFVMQDVIVLQPCGTLGVDLKISAAPGLKVTEGAPQRWSIKFDEKHFTLLPGGASSGTITALDSVIPIALKVQPKAPAESHGFVHIQGTLYLCAGDACFMKDFTEYVRYRVAPDGKSDVRLTVAKVLQQND